VCDAMVPSQALRVSRAGRKASSDLGRATLDGRGGAFSGDPNGAGGAPMLRFSSIPEPSVAEPMAVMAGAGTVTVRLAGEAGQGFTLRMADASARLLAALLAAGLGGHRPRRSPAWRPGPGPSARRAPAPPPRPSCRPRRSRVAAYRPWRRARRRPDFVGRGGQPPREDARAVGFPPRRAPGLVAEQRGAPGAAQAGGGGDVLRRGAASAPERAEPVAGGRLQSRKPHGARPKTCDSPV